MAAETPRRSAIRGTRRRGLRALGALLLGAALQAGCALPQRLDAPAPAAGGETTALDRQIHRDLIRSMLDRGQYYAALAHVQQRGNERGVDREELRYFEAEARRGLGEVAAADALYKALLRGPLAAPAYHGLGLLHARAQLDLAVGYLREAARRRPTDADIRNDLGYALLRAGRHAEALPELATAVELAPESEKARNNLLLLLIARGDEAAVARVANEAGASPATIERLRRQAAGLPAPARARGSRP